MDNQINIEEVTSFSPEVADAARNLVWQLSPEHQPLNNEDVQNMISSSNTHLYVARTKNDNTIVGMITLEVYRIPLVMKAQLEDVVVDEKMRGKGIGKQLVIFAIEKAKEFGVKSLNFTSSPQKEAANKMYESLGFEKRDTNVYRLSL